MGTRGYHSGRMDERAHRCGTRHGIRKPGMQGKLSRLTDGAAEDQNHRHRNRRLVRVQGSRIQLHEIQRSRLEKQNQDADHEAEIAQPGRHERFQLCRRRVGNF